MAAAASPAAASAALPAAVVPSAAAGAAEHLTIPAVSFSVTGQLTVSDPILVMREFKGDIEKVLAAGKPLFVGKMMGKPSTIESVKFCDLLTETCSRRGSQLLDILPGDQKVPFSQGMGDLLSLISGILGKKQFTEAEASELIDKISKAALLIIDAKITTLEATKAEHEAKPKAAQEEPARTIGSSRRRACWPCTLL